MNRDDARAMLYAQGAQIILNDLWLYIVKRSLEVDGDGKLAFSFPIIDASLDVVAAAENALLKEQGWH